MTVSNSVELLIQDIFRTIVHQQNPIIARFQPRPATLPSQQRQHLMESPPKPMSRTEMITRVVGTKRFISRDKLQAILQVLQISESDEVIARTAADDRQTSFDTETLRDLLIRAANRPGADKLARKLHDPVCDGISSLRAFILAKSTIERGDDDGDSIVSYDEDEPHPEIEQEEVMPVFRKRKVNGETYLPGFYDRLECYVKSPRRFQS
jgi:hypothetical protein